MKSSAAQEKIRFFPLKYKFITAISCILILVLGLLATVLGGVLGRTLKKELVYRGQAVAKSLAATSRADLVTYNYVALERAANQAADGQDIVYVIIQDKEGRIAGYSDHPELQGSMLEEHAPVHGTGPVIDEKKSAFSDLPVLEVSTPVTLQNAETSWGTIRVGLSLLPMRHEIRLIQGIIAGIGAFALLGGILLSLWAAQRITKPLNNLVRATQKAVNGDLQQDLRVLSGDEIEILAAHFFQMISEVLAQRTQLELKLAEISRLERYREKLLSTMADGLLSVDRKGCLVTVNPAARDMLGLDDVKGPGLPIEDLPEYVAPLKHLAAEMLANPELISGSGSTREVAFVRGDQRQYVLLGVSVLMDETSAPLEVIINLHDVTQLKELERNVRQSERLSALGTLAAGMAHEIRNPLAAIKTFVQLLPRKISKPGFLDKFQRTVPREIERINQLVEELLELSRMPRYHFEPTDVQELLRHTLLVLEEEMLRHEVKWNLTCQPLLPLVWADGEQLIKAFHNIVRNAIQAMEDGGVLQITGNLLNGHQEQGRDGNEMLKEESWLEIVFEDTGSGIKEEILDRIFNPFFTTKERGTGLGLAITHKVITEHQGSVAFFSDPGKGTKVVVRLPVHQSAFSDQPELS